MSNNNLNNSNFFSTVCDRSQWMKLNCDLTGEKVLNKELDLDNSICSITEDMERQLAFLNEVDDDLNDAKLSLNEGDSSMISGKSLPINHHLNHMNMTTPIQPKIRNFIDPSEDMRNLNTGLNSQQSFSSFLTNINFGTSQVSQSSSFQTEEARKIPSNTVNNKFNMNQVGGNKFNPPTNNAQSRNLANNIVNVNSSTQNSVDSSQHYNTSSSNSYYQHGQNNYMTGNFYNVANYSHMDFVNNKGNYFTVNPAPYFFGNNPAYSFSNTMNPNNTIDAKGKNPNLTMNINPLPNMFKINPNDERSLVENSLLLIKDQNGCRLIQKKLEEKNPEFIHKFFEKIKLSLNEVICDQFGNYVIQKFAECVGAGSPYISKILEKIKNKLFVISTNCYGTRGFQKLLDYVSSESDFEVIKEFLSSNNNIFNLIKDLNGNHVMQKIILLYPVNKNSFIMTEICKNILEITKLKQGGCIFQKCIEKSLENEKNLLTKAVISNIENIINDEHGNFILQYIVNLKNEKYNELIFDYVKKNFILLSKQKYSSNVIDKCILYEDSQFRSELIDKMLELKCINELIVDQYANYGMCKYLIY
jgi:hypothetical protein